jgi:hypothetical protein
MPYLKVFCLISFIDVYSELLFCFFELLDYIKLIFALLYY